MEKSNEPQKCKRSVADRFVRGIIFAGLLFIGFLTFIFGVLIFVFTMLGHDGDDNDD